MWDIRNVILAGDFIHWASLASFPDSETDTAGEIAEIEPLIEPFIEPFERVLWIAGNHDRRPALALERAIPQSYLNRLVIPPDFAAEFNRKVTVSDYYYCLVGDEWQIEHPKATSTVPANAARQIATAADRSVAMGHNHLVGMQQVPNGRHLAFEIGCCVDMTRLAYPNIRHTTRPKMTTGALILRKGADGRFYPHLLNPMITDWEFEMRGEPIEEKGVGRHKRNGVQKR